MRQLIFATGNEAKIREIRQIMPAGFEILSLKDIGFVGDIPETADSLEGNALIKARFVSEKFRLDCFADDTGLEVKALGGRPGVYSARYAGPQCSFEDNIRKLLGEMNGHDLREARFRTVIAAIIGGEEKTFEGISAGEITKERKGEAGFGYDPIFLPTGFSKTFAEMSAEEKNAISHRGRALRKFIDFLKA